MSRSKSALRLGLLVLLLCVAGPATAADVRVYAAASLGTALKEIAATWQAGRDDRIVANFAASSTLAKQLELGAPADLFISADRLWMDYLEQHARIDRASRRDLLGNRLVLIAPTAEPKTVAMGAGQVPEFFGKLCMGEPGSVPAGVYGKQALIALDWWQGLKGRIVATEDVRGALAFVERGECLLGIVYETDARGSSKVMIAGKFPASTHEPVVYPAALLVTASPVAREFFDYLSGPEARVVFLRHGFAVLAP